MRKLKVAQIVGKLYGGGVEKVVFNYCRAIDKNKVQFDIFYDADSTVEPPKDLINSGINFYKIPPYQKLWKYIPRLYSLLKKNDYDIVHSNINTLSVFPLFVAEMAGVKIRIAHNHSVPSKNEGIRTIMKYSLRPFSKTFANVYFACSEKAGRWLFGNKEYARGNVTFIPNAIYFNRLRQKMSKEQKKLLGIGKNTLVLGHVGRMTFAKNQLFLIDIFKKVHQVQPDSILIIVGDGEYREKIEEAIRENHLVDCVKLIGQSSNPEMYYSAMNVFILPSYFEGLSMATIEAQVGGVPVVVSQAVPPEADISNQFYQLSLIDSSKKWANKAIDVSHNTVKLSKKGEIYDISKSASRLYEQYRQLVENTK